MKNILKTIYAFFESIGEARAASHFARQGNYTAAKEVMKHD